MRYKKIVFFLVVMIGTMHILETVKNPEGHDYNIYSRNLESNTLSDLPAALLIMFVFKTIFGNPQGLYVLSAFSCFALYFIFLYKIQKLDYERLTIFSLIYFWIYPVWYLSKGVLRNLMGLCFISLFILYDDEKDRFYNSFILSAVHIPTLMIYLFYKLSRKKFRSVIYSIISLGLMIGLGYYFKGMIWASSMKPVRMILTKINNPFYYAPFTFKGINVSIYALIVFSFCFYGFFKFMKKYDYDLIFWLAMLILPFIPIYFYKVQYRFLLFTTLPILMLITHDYENENKYQKLYLFSIGFISIVVRIMGIF